jgi:solute carrier family 13 (sodium-dependent dicarboxylate transporter), member 2/3/5
MNISVKKLFRSPRLLVGYFLGPAVFLYLVFFADLEPGKPAVTYTLAAGFLMAIFWITEVIPLAATSLLPVVLFPFLGIMDGKEVSSTYFNHVIFLFLGGFLVALAMQRWNLHKRIALRILMLTGAKPASILLGFMLATAFISMWMSNTATAMMMIPILLSVMQNLEESVEKSVMSKYSVGLLLGVAYSASIGGIATLVGTPPNLSFIRIFQIMFPAAPEVNFTLWFFYAFPMTVCIFLFTWWLLYFRYGPRKGQWVPLEKGLFREHYKALGPMIFEEKIILADFIILALLWLSRSGLDFGTFVIPGWSKLFASPEYVNDGTVAVLMAVILFFIPSKTEKGVKIMNWETAGKLPWHIVLLFGGGFALATAFANSGLSEWFGVQLKWLSNLHPFFIILMISLLVAFLTELTSNTATTEMILPILAGLAVSIEINPLFLMLPATISASMAFMLPVATPPNAIIFGTNKLTIADMAKTGLIIDLVGSVIITVFTYFLVGTVFNHSGLSLPAWAIDIK